MSDQPRTPSPENQDNNEDYGGDEIDYSGIFEHDDFATSELAIEWAKNVAIQSGFCLTTSTWKTQRDGRYDKLLKCDRSSKKVDRDLTTAVRFDTKRKGCGCLFKIKVCQRRDLSGWHIVGASKWGKHNHELVVYPQGHRQISGISPGAKKVVHEMTEAQVRPAKILATLLEKYPADNPNKRHVYNERDKIRRGKSEGRNPIQQLLYQAIKYNYLHWFKSDEATDVVTHVFLVHPMSADLLRTYPYVILIDSTYKTNKYKYPLVEIIGMTPGNMNFVIGYAIMKDETESSYRWVLEKLKNYVGPEVHPSSIVTDCEGGLFAPIRDLFPNSAHLLCTWHINKCVLNKAYHCMGKNKVSAEKFQKGRWRQVMYATTQEQYEDNVQFMMDCYSWCPTLLQYVTQQWIPHKEKFVLYWTNQVLHFGNTTTCRVESAHNALKDWLNSSTSALDTLFERVNKAIETQVNGIKQCLEDSRRRHGTLYRGRLYQNLHGRTSHHCLSLLEQEKSRMSALSDEIDIRCGCALKTTHGIPCACTISRIIQSGESFYLDQIHPFWRSLIIGEVVDPNIVDRSTQDTTRFDELTGQVRASHPSFVRDATLLLHGMLHPDESEIREPEGTTITRGRPRRDFSAWEYMERNAARGRGRG